MGIVNIKQAQEKVLKNIYLEEQIKSLESEDSQISSLIREQYSQVREYDLLHQSNLKLVEMGVISMADLPTEYQEFLNYRQQCIDEVRGEEPVVEYFIQLSIDGGETFTQRFLTQNFEEKMTWEKARLSEVLVDGMNINNVNGKIYLGNMPIKYNGIEVSANDTIMIGGEYVTI